MSSYNIFVNCQWKLFLQLLYPVIYYFVNMIKKHYEYNLLLVTHHNIYQKQKIELIFLDPEKNNGHFCKVCIFPNFVLPSQRKWWRHKKQSTILNFSYREMKDNMLVNMYAKFEVKYNCDLARLGTGRVNLSHHAQTLPRKLHAQSG